MTRTEPKRLSEDIQSAVRIAIELCRLERPQLFATRINTGTPQERGASERAISHRLGFYLELALKNVSFDKSQSAIDYRTSELAKWNVDCEYNRLREDQEKFLLHSDLSQACDALEERTKAATLKESKDRTNFDDYLLQFTTANFGYVRREIEKAEEGDADVRRKLTAPDIIVHERHKNGVAHNWLLIEIKPDWAEYGSVLLDLVKIVTFTRKKDGDSPTYQFALFLHFQCDGVVRPSGRIASWLISTHEGNCEPILFS
ncbi:MAG: hypothetical protein WCT03_08695 [Candidatus Obscuribacterales bacterium]